MAPDATTTNATAGNTLPHPSGSLLPALARALRVLWARTPIVTGIGVVGVGSAGLLVAAVLVRGNAVPPEGNLIETATFNGGLGIFLLTVAALAALAEFTRAGYRVWVGSLAVLVLASYSIETVQAFRGLDPRFSAVASPADQALGGVFFGIANGVMITFLILAAKFFRPTTAHLEQALRLSVRYAALAAVIGFGVGDAMSVMGGRHVEPAGNLLPLHAGGFHGLQAIPLVAVLLTWSKVPARVGNRVTHIAGVAWLIACGALAVQSFSGRPLLTASAWLALAVLALLVWAACAIFAVRGVVGANGR